MSRTTAPTRLRETAGRPDDERHPQHALVDEDAVIALAMLAERLAVIAGDDDDRRSREAPPVERVEQPADLRVGERDLPDIRVAVASSDTAPAARTAGADRRDAPTGRTGAPNVVEPPQRVVDDVVRAPLARVGRSAVETRPPLYSSNPCARPRSGIAARPSRQMRRCVKPAPAGPRRASCALGERLVGVVVHAVSPAETTR